MRRYNRIILQDSTMEGLIDGIRFVFDFGDTFEIEGEIEARLTPNHETGCQSITGYYVVLKKRLTLWQWLKCVFWK